jgi:diguanylate cyclase (GGDEF)-like protein/PAS domain S-box-containing protein
MDTQSKTKNYMLVILALGFVCLVWAFLNLPIEKADFQLLILFGFTIGFGSRITIQIPKLKSRIAVSDTFIFFALLLYGGEIAVILAAVEALFSSWRFCNKKITVFFNVSAMALSTTAVVFVLKLFGLYTESQLNGHGSHLDNFIIVLWVMAFTQFLVNTPIAAVYGALRSEKPFWETWETKYLWVFVTYFIGAVSAGVMIQLTNYIGFGVVVVSFPITYFIYLTYRMYLKNVEMADAQAEQAEQHASILEEQSVALRESEERFRSAFNYAPIGIALVSPEGNWLKVNHALVEILGYSQEELLGKDFQSILFAEDLQETLAEINKLLLGKIPTCQMEQRYRHKIGRTVWTSWSVSAASDGKNEHPNLIFQIQDITEKKFAEEKLQYEATHDALTNLPNRAMFMSRLDQALENILGNSDHKVSVLFIDLDRFKVVNDSLGHLFGDQLLFEIAGRLRECLRPEDLVARLGGDEFTILVEGNHDPKEVVKIAERIQAKFAEPFDLGGREVYSSASIGILHNSEKHLAAVDMMRDADTAMYQAKRAGKARHEVFNDGMHEAVKETLQLETELRRAIEKDEFTVFYQPIYSLASGEIQGFEALARWEHETEGFISPEKFIPLAEELGLIETLGEQILRKACRQGSILQKNFPADAPFMISVNVSCKQFAQPLLVKRIKRILEETNFAPERLKIEITESVFIEHRERAVEMLNQLRDIGVEINIDDFGTGYSNLSYLMQLPISTLKIDRSFINPLEFAGRNLEIVQTILTLACNLGMTVIAEGVETEAQLEQLKNLNCASAQGFYFAKPMCFEDIKKFLDEKDTLPIPDKNFEDVSIVSTIQ